MWNFLRLGCICTLASACVLEAAPPVPKDAAVAGPLERGPDAAPGGATSTGPSTTGPSTSEAASATGASVGTASTGSAGASTGTSAGSGGGAGAGGASSSPSDAGGSTQGTGGRGGSGSVDASVDRADGASAKVDASAALADAAVDYNTPLVCTSGDHWLNGDRGAAAMHPGRECIACHSMKNGPAFAVAGTIFPTAHEPDDCNGADGLFVAAVVYVTGADGQTVSVTPNFAGNFAIATNTRIALPFRAKVVANGKERAMQTPQMIGDCNSCHTVVGKNGAPGRIVIP